MLIYILLLKGGNSKHNGRIISVWIASFKEILILVDCNVLSLMSWLCCVVFRITLIVMLRVLVLRSCGVLLCVVNTLSGQCAVLSTCIVIVTYRVL